MNIFYLLKRTRTLNVSGDNKHFDADFRSVLEKQDTLFITKFSKTTSNFGGCSSPNDLSLDKCGVKTYVKILNLTREIVLK